MRLLTRVLGRLAKVGVKVRGMDNDRDEAKEAVNGKPNIKEEQVEKQGFEHCSACCSRSAWKHCLRIITVAL